MLEKLTVSQTRQIIILADEARTARDALLHGVAAADISEPVAARGERNGVDSDTFGGLPEDDRSVQALHRAIEALWPSTRHELFALMRIGQGDFAAGDWDRALSEAAALGDESVKGILNDDIDLASHLGKGLYALSLG